jgi:hypothetical protein
VGRRSLIIVAALLVPRLVFAQTAFSNRRPGDAPGYTFESISPSSGSTLKADGVRDTLNITGTAPITVTGANSGNTDTLTLALTTPLTLANGGNGAAPSADDQVLVSSSTTAGSWATLPSSCTDTGGNHLNYNAATNAFSCGTTSSSSHSIDVETNSSVAVNVLSGSPASLLTFTTFSNVGKTTILSGAVSITTSGTGAARFFTMELKLGGTTQVTFRGKTESATSYVSIPFHWSDTTCGSSCSFTLTIYSDSVSGTQTATAVSGSRLTY